MFRGGDSQFIVEAVMPDFGHVIPVVDDTMLDGVGQFQDTFLGLSFFSDIGLLVIHADHDVLIFRSADDGGER